MMVSPLLFGMWPADALTLSARYSVRNAIYQSGDERSDITGTAPTTHCRWCRRSQSSKIARVSDTVGMFAGSGSATGRARARIAQVEARARRIDQRITELPFQDTEIGSDGETPFSFRPYGNKQRCAAR